MFNPPNLGLAIGGLKYRPHRSRTGSAAAQRLAVVLDRKLHSPRLVRELP